MERYNFFEDLKEISSSESGFVCESPDYSRGVMLDYAISCETDKADGAYAARVLNCTEVINPENVPSGIVGCYSLENGIIKRQKYIHKGDFLVFCETLDNYVNLTGSNAVAALIEKAERKAKKKEFYCVNNNIFTSRILWSNTLKKAFKEKYKENPADKLALLFIKAEGCERFRERYYSILRSTVAENFLQAVKLRSRDMGVPFFAVTNCSLTAATQVLPNNNFIGFSSVYDRVFLRCPKELIYGEFLRRYFKFFTNINSEKIAAEISFESFCMLPPETLKNFVARLFANGIKKICIASPVSLSSVLLKKKELLENYIRSLGAALNLGKKADEMLAVYPSASAASEFNVNDLSTSKAFNGEIEKKIDMLNRTDILYDFAGEYQIGNEVKISGALITANGNTYTGLVLMAGVTVSPRLAGFIIKYAENGGRVYTLSDLPQMIDGFKSSKLPELNSCIKPIGRAELYQLRLSGSPAFADMSIDLYALRLKDNSMLYFASNIIEESGSVSFNTYEDVALLDIFNSRESICLNSNKVGKVTGKQVIELDKDYVGCAMFRVGKPFYDASEVTERCNVQLSPYFDIVNADDNNFVLNRCRFRINTGRWQPENTVPSVIRQLSRYNKSYNAEFKFEFTVSKTDENTRVLLYFKNQNRYKLSVNLYPVLCSGNSFTDITEYITNGENYIILSADGFDKMLKEDENALSNLILRGNFCTMSKSAVKNEKSTIITKNDFALTKSADAISIERILESGFWFFDGSIELSQKFVLEKKENIRYFISFREFSALAADITVNGIKTGSICFKPYETDVTESLISGENEINIRLYANQVNFRVLNQNAANEIEFEPFFAKFQSNETEKAFVNCFDVTKYKDINGIKTEALRSVNLSIQKGEFVVVYGPKGSGKTTLFNLLGCMDSADSGQIRIGEKDISGYTNSQMTAFRKKDIAFVFSEKNLIDIYTVSENIELACREKLQAYDLGLVLRSVGLNDKADSFPKDLSLEEQQRAAIARAIAKNPQLVLCDEPAALLSNVSGQIVIQLLKEISRLTEKTVVVFTSDETVCDMADRVIRLKDGAVAENTLISKQLIAERT